MSKENKKKNNRKKLIAGLVGTCAAITSIALIGGITACIPWNTSNQSTKDNSKPDIGKNIITLINKQLSKGVDINTFDNTTTKQIVEEINTNKNNPSILKKIAEMCGNIKGLIAPFNPNNPKDHVQFNINNFKIVGVLNKQDDIVSTSTNTIISIRAEYNVSNNPAKPDWIPLNPINVGSFMSNSYANSLNENNALINALKKYCPSSVSVTGTNLANGDINNAITSTNNAGTISQIEGIIASNINKSLTNNKVVLQAPYTFNPKDIKVTIVKSNNVTGKMQVKVSYEESPTKVTTISPTNNTSVTGFMTNSALNNQINKAIVKKLESLIPSSITISSTQSPVDAWNTTNATNTEGEIVKAGKFSQYDENGAHPIEVTVDGVTYHFDAQDLVPSLKNNTTNPNNGTCDITWSYNGLPIPNATTKVSGFKITALNKFVSNLLPQVVNIDVANVNSTVGNDTYLNTNCPFMLSNNSLLSTETKTSTTPATFGQLNVYSVYNLFIKEHNSALFNYISQQLANNIKETTIKYDNQTYTPETFVDAFLTSGSYSLDFNVLEGTITFNGTGNLSGFSFTVSGFETLKTYLSTLLKQTNTNIQSEFKDNVSTILNNEQLFGNLPGFVQNQKYIFAGSLSSFMSSLSANNNVNATNWLNKTFSMKALYSIFDSSNSFNSFSMNNEKGNGTFANATFSSNQTTTDWYNINFSNVEVVNANGNSYISYTANFGTNELYSGKFSFTQKMFSNYYVSGLQNALSTLPLPSSQDSYVGSIVANNINKNNDSVQKTLNDEINQILSNNHLKDMGQNKGISIVPDYSQVSVNANGDIVVPITITQGTGVNKTTITINSTITPKISNTQFQTNLQNAIKTALQSIKTVSVANADVGKQPAAICANDNWTNSKTSLKSLFETAFINALKGKDVNGVTLTESYILSNILNNKTTLTQPTKVANIAKTTTSTNWLSNLEVPVTVDGVTGNNVNFTGFMSFDTFTKEIGSYISNNLQNPIVLSHLKTILPSDFIKNITNYTSDIQTAIIQQIKDLNGVSFDGYNFKDWSSVLGSDTSALKEISVSSPLVDGLQIQVLGQNIEVNKEGTNNYTSWYLSGLEKPFVTQKQLTQYLKKNLHKTISVANTGLAEQPAWFGLFSNVSQLTPGSPIDGNGIIGLNGTQGYSIYNLKTILSEYKQLVQSEITSFLDKVKSANTPIDGINLTDTVINNFVSSITGMNMSVNSSGNINSTFTLNGSSYNETSVEITIGKTGISIPLTFTGFMSASTFYQKVYSYLKQTLNKPIELSGVSNETAYQYIIQNGGVATYNFSSLSSLLGAKLDLTMNGTNLFSWMDTAFNFNLINSKTHFVDMITGIGGTNGGNAGHFAPGQIEMMPHNYSATMDPVSQQFTTNALPSISNLQYQIGIFPSFFPILQGDKLNTWAQEFISTFEKDAPVITFTGFKKPTLSNSEIQNYVAQNFKFNDVSVAGTKLADQPAMWCLDKNAIDTYIKSNKDNLVNQPVSDWIFSGGNSFGYVDNSTWSEQQLLSLIQTKVTAFLQGKKIKGFTPTPEQIKNYVDSFSLGTPNYLNVGRYYNTLHKYNNLPYLLNIGSNSQNAKAVIFTNFLPISQYSDILKSCTQNALNNPIDIPNVSNITPTQYLETYISVQIITFVTNTLKKVISNSKNIVKINGINLNKEIANNLDFFTTNLRKALVKGKTIINVILNCEGYDSKTDTWNPDTPLNPLTPDGATTWTLTGFKKPT